MKNLILAAVIVWQWHGLLGVGGADDVTLFLNRLAPWQARLAKVTATSTAWIIFYPTYQAAEK